MKKQYAPQFHMAINLAEMGINLADFGKSFIKYLRRTKQFLPPGTNRQEFYRLIARILNSINSFKYGIKKKYFYSIRYQTEKMIKHYISAFFVVTFPMRFMQIFFRLALQA